MCVDIPTRHGRAGGRVTPPLPGGRASLRSRGLLSGLGHISARTREVMWLGQRSSELLRPQRVQRVQSPPAQDVTITHFAAQRLPSTKHDTAYDADRADDLKSDSEQIYSLDLHEAAQHLPGHLARPAALLAGACSEPAGVAALIDATSFGNSLSIALAHPEFTGHTLAAQSRPRCRRTRSFDGGRPGGTTGLVRPTP